MDFPTLPDDIIELNRKLLDEFGYFADTSEPKYRISWSNDRFEYRLGDYPKLDGHGNFLGIEENVVKYVPCYRQWIKSKWVMERCLAVISEKIGLYTKYTFEPIWPFEDKAGNALPPVWDVCLVVVDMIHKAAASAVGHTNFKPRYLPQLEDMNNKEGTKARIDNLMKEMYGNETATTDSLAVKSGVSLNHSERNKL